MTTQRRMNIIAVSGCAQKELNFIISMRNTRYSAIILNADNQLAAVGIRHSRQRFNDVPGNFFGLSLFMPGISIVKGCLPIEELPLRECGPAGYVGVIAFACPHITSIMSFHLPEFQKGTSSSMLAGFFSIYLFMRKTIIVPDK